MKASTEVVIEMNGEAIRPHSTFSKWQKRWIIVLASFAGWFSTLSSFIFFPAIPTLAQDLHTSIEKINLTVTSYLIFAAVAPSIVGNVADTSGRRPSYIATLIVYIVANIGLATQSSFAALFILRMLQAASISSAILQIGVNLCVN
jgi:MFS family permease